MRARRSRGREGFKSIIDLNKGGHPMARQILTGEDVHKAALELLNAGLLDSNPVALGDGAFEVSLKPQLSDELHFAEVDKLLKDLKTSQTTTSTSWGNGTTEQKRTTTSVGGSVQKQTTTTWNGNGDEPSQTSTTTTNNP
jgi:hypothetical protein